MASHLAVILLLWLVFQLVRRFPETEKKEPANYDAPKWRKHYKN